MQTTDNNYRSDYFNAVACVMLQSDNDKFAKAVGRFTKEDPTFKVHLDEESKEVSAVNM